MTCLASARRSAVRKNKAAMTAIVNGTPVSTPATTTSQTNLVTSPRLETFWNVSTEFRDAQRCLRQVGPMVISVSRNSVGFSFSAKPKLSYVHLRRRTLIAAQVPLSGAEVHPSVVPHVAPIRCCSDAIRRVCLAVMGRHSGSSFKWPGHSIAYANSGRVEVEVAASKSNESQTFDGRIRPAVDCASRMQSLVDSVVCRTVGVAVRCLKMSTSTGPE